MQLLEHLFQHRDLLERQRFAEINQKGFFGDVLKRGGFAASQALTGTVVRDWFRSVEDIFRTQSLEGGRKEKILFELFSDTRHDDRR